MFEVNLRDKRPIYEQIRQQLSRQVSLGILQPNTPLPSVRALSLELGINPNTVQKAYRMMEAEGLIYSVPGKGSFITERTDEERKRRQQEQLEQMASLAREAREHGIAAEALHTVIRTVYEEV